MLCLGFSLNVNAQEVKIQKGLVTIEGKPFVSWEHKGVLSIAPNFVKSEPQGIPLFSLQSKIYEEKNPLYEKNKDLSPTRKVAYNTIRFIDFDGELTTYMTTKSIMREMHNMAVVDSEGKVNEENARKFIRIYHEEINTGETIIIQGNDKKVIILND